MIRALAQAMAADPQAGLPDPEETITTIPDLVLWDDAIARLPVEERTAMARAAERAALDYDSRITNSEGGEYSSSQSHVLYASSHGFVGHYQAGTVGLSVSPIASEAGGMQSDYWFATGRKLSQLQAPVAIGQEAARRHCGAWAPAKWRRRKCPWSSIHPRLPVCWDMYARQCQARLCTVGHRSCSIVWTRASPLRR